MAATRTEYLQSLGTMRFASTLPITYSRPNMYGDPVDPGNNIGRTCDLSSGVLSADHLAELGWGRTGKTWQIIGVMPDGSYWVVHVDDPQGCGITVDRHRVTNLY